MGSRFCVGLFYWAKHMTDVAAIGIVIETDGLDKGIKKLSELAQQGPKVEASMAGISGEAKRVAKDLAELGVGGGDGLKKTSEAAKQAATGLKASGTAAREAVTDTESLRRALATLTGEEERFVKSLEKQYNAMTMGRGDFEAYNAAQRGMGAGAQEVVRAMGGKIDALKAEQSALAANGAAMERAIGIAKNLALAFAGGAFYKQFIAETMNAEQEQAQLAAVLKSTGEAAGWSQQKLNDMAASMSKNSVFSGGEISKAQTRLLSYVNVTGQQFPRAMQAAIDMSQRMGMSVEQAAEKIGKALDVPSEGLTALSREGFRFGDAQKALVEHFETLGKTAEAQGVILKSVEESYGGAAAAARDTLGGSLAGLKNTINDLMAGSGGSVEGLTASINGLSGSLASEATHQAFISLTTWMTDATNVAVRLVNALAMLGAGNIGGAMLDGKALNNPASALVDVEARMGRIRQNVAAHDPKAEGWRGARNSLWSVFSDDYEDSMAQLKIASDQRATLLGMVNTSQYGDNAPDVEALTGALQKQNVVLGKTAEWIRSYGTAVEKADLAVKEWRKQLGDGLTADMEKTIRSSFKEKGGAKGTGQQEKAVSDIRARILAEEELIKRLQERGVAAQGLSESDRLVGKLQQEIAGTTNKRTKANLEVQLAEALVWQTTQKSRTELEKHLKVQDEAEKSYRKYIDSLFKSADAMADMADKQDAANASFGKSKVAIAEMAAEQAKLAFLNAKEMGPWTPEQVAGLKALTDQHERYVKSLREAEFLTAQRKYEDSIKAAKDELQIQQYSMSLLGEEEITRNKLVAIRKTELKLAKELADIAKLYDGRDDAASVKQRTELEGKARINAELELQGELGRIQDQYISEQVGKYGDIFRQGFVDFVNNGVDGLKAFGKSLKTTILTSVADALYKAFAQKFVMNVVANMSGGWLSALGSLVGLAGGGGSGGSGTLGTLGNLGSMGNTAYNAYTGQGVAGQVYNYGAGLLGYGAAPWGAAGVQTSGAVTMPVTGSLGSTAPGSGASIGWGATAALAIPFIAAYLGGMFKDEKMVGSGLTGTLGGDMYGYQLMRESGGLFDGPDYRYLIAEKEIKDTKAKIEALKKDPAYDGKGEAARESKLQALYNKLDNLELNYGDAIAGSQGPIKILQDAFKAMREGTASQADSLGLDGDSIRKMQVELGLEPIHADTGGKGLELTGLTQAEAGAKIQAALDQANEELARSVLGSWQEQTKEVTRTIWESVAVDDGGDTERYMRVGKQITETITENVFVMSEYVREGETAVQALGRLSTSLLTANHVFDLLGGTLFDTSLAGADMASDLMDLFGGADKFVASTSNYYDKFYSDQDKVDTQTRLLNAELRKLGIETMPASREALTDYIDGLDLTTEGGQKLFASLMGLVDVFDMIYTSAENIASLKGDLGMQLLRAQGNDKEATRLEREKQIKELEKYKDPELVKLQKDVWAAEDKNKADADAKQALEAAQSAGLANLQAAIGREKEYWTSFTTDAKDALTKASSYFDLVTGAAKSLRGSIDDTSSWNAAAGMVYIEQALANARMGLGLSDFDKTRDSIGAATGGLVMDNYATQAELNYDKKMLAGQLDELGGFAELAKSDAQKQLDIGNAQIKRLDETLKFWQDYGKDQVDATMSVTDAVNALFKLLDPKEQERIKAEEAAKAGLVGGGATGTSPIFSGGGVLGGSVAGSNRVTVIGLTADGRAMYSDGSIGQSAAGQYSYNSDGLMTSNGYSAAEFERFKASGEYELDPATGNWRKRKSFAVGTNFVPYDMTANIHKGEAIIPAADNRALMAALNNQGGGNAELVAEVRALRAELQDIKGNTAATAEYSRRTSSDLNQVTENGNAMRVLPMNA